MQRPSCPHSESESESNNATECVIWKAQDLWSAPVEWSNHEMQAQKSNESMQSSAAAIGGHPPSGGCLRFLCQAVLFAFCVMAASAE